MAELSTSAREKLDKRKFAYVDKEGVGHLPIHDDSHVRNAMARWNQTDILSTRVPRSRRAGRSSQPRPKRIDVSDDDRVAKGHQT